MSLRRSAEDIDLARGGGEESDRQVHESGFSGSVGSDQPDQASCRNAQVTVAQSPAAPVLLAQAGCKKSRIHATPST